MSKLIGNGTNGRRPPKADWERKRDERWRDRKNMELIEAYVPKDIASHLRKAAGTIGLNVSARELREELRWCYGAFIIVGFTEANTSIAEFTVWMTKINMPNVPIMTMQIDLQKFERELKHAIN